MKVKVCGMRDTGNLETLLKLPIDYVGFIFYAGSNRFAGKEKGLAEWITEHPEAFESVKKVGVFVNAGIHELLNTVHDFQLDMVQLHGNESPEYCQELQLLWRASSVRKAEVIKAFSIDQDFDFQQTQAYATSCSLFIFDTKGAGFGGTGKQFDWNLLKQYEGHTPFLLSGGIGPEDGEAVNALHHFHMIGVDLNSKFEITPGLKIIDPIQAFVHAIKH